VHRNHRTAETALIEGFFSTLFQLFTEALPVCCAAMRIHLPQTRRFEFTRYDSHSIFA
jgi:hypothetical protein